MTRRSMFGALFGAGAVVTAAPAVVAAVPAVPVAVPDDTTHYQMAAIEIYGVVPADRWMSAEKITERVGGTEHRPGGRLAAVRSHLERLEINDWVSRRSIGGRKVYQRYRVHASDIEL